jgi:hypothetical protein
MIEDSVQMTAIGVTGEPARGLLRARQRSHRFAPVQTQGRDQSFVSGRQHCPALYRKGWRFARVFDISPHLGTGGFA